MYVVPRTRPLRHGLLIGSADPLRKGWRWWRVRETPSEEHPEASGADTMLLLE